MDITSTNFNFIPSLELEITGWFTNPCAHSTFEIRNTIKGVLNVLLTNKLNCSLLWILLSSSSNSDIVSHVAILSDDSGPASPSCQLLRIVLISAKFHNKWIIGNQKLPERPAQKFLLGQNKPILCLANDLQKLHAPYFIWFEKVDAPRVFEKFH